MFIYSKLLPLHVDNTINHLKNTKRTSKFRAKGLYLEVSSVGLEKICAVSILVKTKAIT
jgi:hypothetical protein